MPEIFLSYSRQDVAVAAEMAAVLAAAGHDVWWDREIRAGDVYDQVLETALREARLVIVLWSKTAVASDWVRSEATVAMQRGTLMPVMIEDCQRPVAFELRQSADLIGWKGNARDPRLQAVLAEVARQLGAPAAPVPATARQTGPSRRLLIGGAAGAAALAAGGFGAWKVFGGKRDDGTASVVVLPFANLSGDPAQAYFSDGIAEELRNALSQIGGLRVTGRVSSERFRDSNDLVATAAALGVDHVLTGSVRRSPTTIRISAQLVDGRTGVESWSASYDQPIGDALAIQSKIASNVVTALSAKLAASAGNVIVGGTSNPQAQELLLKSGQAFYNADTAGGFQEAQRLQNAVIAIDPTCAIAWAGLAFTKVNLADFVDSAAAEQALIADALAASKRAVARAPASGMAWLALGFCHQQLLDMRQALAEGERAYALAPGVLPVIYGFGQLLSQFDPDRAVEIVRTAAPLDPFNPFYFVSLAICLLAARRPEEAIDAIKRASDPGTPNRASALLSVALVATGQFDALRAQIPNLDLESSRLAVTAIVEARAGKGAASDAALAQLRRFNGPGTDVDRAAAYAQSGHTDAALDALEAALRHKDRYLSRIRVSNWYDPIRGEPRFKAVQDAVIPPDLWVPPKRG